jgi:hypothetical protein
MDQQTFEELLADVSKHFANPETLLAREDFTREQKLALLRQWEYDLHLLQVATEENMTGDTPPGDNAETLREVRAAAEQLGVGPTGKGDGSAKAGSVMPEKAMPEKARTRR